MSKSRVKFAVEQRLPFPYCGKHNISLNQKEREALTSLLSKLLAYGAIDLDSDVSSEERHFISSIYLKL